MDLNGQTSILQSLHRPTDNILQDTVSGTTAQVNDIRASILRSTGVVATSQEDIRLSAEAWYLDQISRLYYKTDKDGKIDDESRTAALELYQYIYTNQARNEHRWQKNSGIRNKPNKEESLA